MRFIASPGRAFPMAPSQRGNTKFLYFLENLVEVNSGCGVIISPIRKVCRVKVVVHDASGQFPAVFILHHLLRAPCARCKFADHPFKGDNWPKYIVDGMAWFCWIGS